MQLASTNTITLHERKIEYRVTRSKAARKLRVRVGPRGVQVVRPAARPEDEIAPFLRRNEDWIVRQLDRAEKLRAVIKPPRGEKPTLLLRGDPTVVRATNSLRRRGHNKVTLQNRELTILCAAGSRTTPASSLENWLRKQARAAIQAHLKSILPRVKRSPGKIYVMAQRTKWGNCSALGNLSFNWRLIMAPDFVLRYIVTHEAVHLAIPDHSQRFWLTVRSLCPEAERARQWLCANAQRLLTPLPKPSPN
jgi:predicted metal-dependent hydrolase